MGQERRGEQVARGRLPDLRTLALVCVVGGVAVQLQQRSLWPAAWYGAALVLALMAALAMIHWAGRAQKRSRNLAGSPLIGLFLAATLAAGAGFTMTGLRAVLFQSGVLNPALEGKDIAVSGMVMAMPQRSEDAVRFRLQIDSAQFDGAPVTVPPQLLLGWYTAFGAREAKAALAGGDDPAEFLLELQRQPQNLRAGERWQMTVRLKAPHGNSNPHGFDYELWLWEQGIQATGYVRAGPRDPPPARLSESWQHPNERARQAVREAVFERVLNRQLAGVISALLVGDQSAIERADWDVFRATGVAHLMSISGLHITMFAWLAALIFSRLWRQSARWTPRLCLAWPASSAGAVAGLALAIAYALFSGWGVPAQRTIWMLATVVLLRLSGRQWPWPQTWLLAMAVVVLLDPWALMQAGFWLSFVAVGVLFATGSPPSGTAGTADTAIKSIAEPEGIHCARGRFGLQYDRFLIFFVSLSHKVGAGLLAIMREQWVVTLALTPLSLLLFNQVSVVGLLANAVAIPWVTLVVTPLAMLGVFWAPLWDAAAWTISGLALGLQWLAGWPFASVSVAAAPLWAAVAGVMGGALMALRLPWQVRFSGLPLMLPVLLWQAPPVAPGQFELLAADIGQGNAVIVRTASHSLLYDTGPRFSRESDAGHRVLVPLLRARGEQLDKVVLSHRDSDHTGGAPAVLAMQPQAELLASIEDGHELQAIRKATRCTAGQRWVWDGVDFEVLHPAASDYDAPAKSNAMSCVLRISSASAINGGVSRTALLVGDIEAVQEQRLVAAESTIRLKADFLLVPHHGSKTSSTAGFLDAVQPRVALAQSGYRNRFGHPVDSVVARYAERGIALTRSPQCGAAHWSSEAPEKLLCEREINRRYWHHRMVP